MVGPGFLIALNRDNAKRVFGQKDDEGLVALLDELKKSTDLKRKGHILELARAWDALHRLLTEGTLDPTSGEFPLNAVFLGGKSIHQGTDYAAMVVRPDMTPHISEALAEVSEDDVAKKFAELPGHGYDQAVGPKDLQEVLRVLRLLKEFYEFCGNERMAVLFTGAWK